MVLSMHLVSSLQAVFDASRNKLACGTHISYRPRQDTQTIQYAFVCIEVFIAFLCYHADIASASFEVRVS